MAVLMLIRNAPAAHAAAQEPVSPPVRVAESHSVSLSAAAGEASVGGNGSAAPAAGGGQHAAPDTQRGPPHGDLREEIASQAELEEQASGGCKQS